MNLDNTDNRKQFSRIPEDFLKDIFIIPHSFIAPDNPEHGEYVNAQMKQDLFTDTFAKIVDIEMPSLKNEDDFIKLKQIKECEQDSDTFLDKISTQIRKKPEDEIIRCENWTLNLNNDREIDYKVKFYQSEFDRFYALIYPPSLFKYYQLYQTNKSLI